MTRRGALSPPPRARQRARSRARPTRRRTGRGASRAGPASRAGTRCRRAGASCSSRSASRQPTARTPTPLRNRAAAQWRGGGARPATGGLGGGVRVRGGGCPPALTVALRAGRARRCRPGTVGCCRAAWWRCAAWRRRRSTPRPGPASTTATTTDAGRGIGRVEGVLVMVVVGRASPVL